MQRFLPQGTVTILMTDIERSVRLYDLYAERMQAAVDRHYEILVEAIESHSGVEVSSRREGDSLLAFFERASDAVKAATEAQVAFSVEAWPTGERLRVRMALDTGEVQGEAGQIQSEAIRRCARLRSIGHGGHVLLSGTTAALVEAELPDHGRLHSLGAHRVRGLDREMLVYQLLHPRFATDMPPLLVFDPEITNLPLPRDSFVGRLAELAEIEKLRGRSRLITIVGTGGAGKTRLAIHAAAQWLPSFSAGVWFVGLGEIEHESMIAGQIIQSIGAREPARGDPSEALATHISDRPMLLVVDNCEHLIEGCADMVDLLLARCPRLLVLATSRAPLDIPGESLVHLGPLPMDSDHEPDTEAVRLRSDAVRLFLDRARSVAPGLGADDSELQNVADLCALLDGIPLALELAAARLSILPLPTLMQRLQDRFVALSKGRRGAVERHRSLEAVVRWSYDLQSEACQRTFQAISVFASSFSQEAAEYLASPEVEDTSSVEDCLETLVEGSMLIVVPTPDGEQRFRMLETLKAFGRRNHSSAETTDRLLRRQVEYLERLARDLCRQLGEGNQELALSRFGRDQANFLSILPRFKTDWEHERGLYIAAALAEFWISRGLNDQAREHLGRLLSEGQPSDHLLAGALVAHGHLAYDAGDYGLAEQQFERALDIKKDSGDTRSIAWVSRNLAEVHKEQGALERARQEMERVVALCDELGDPSLEYFTLLGLSQVLEYEGQLELASEAARKCRRMALEHHDQQHIAKAELSLCWIHLRFGRIEAAADHLDRALDRRRTLDEIWAIAEALVAKGTLAHARLDPEAAQEMLEEGLRMARKVDDGRTIADALAELGRVQRSMGKDDQALEYLVEALARTRVAGRRFFQAEILEDLALLYAGGGNLDAAESRAQDALLLRQACGSPVGLGRAHAVMARLACERGDVPLMREKLRQSLEIRRGLDSSVPLIETAEESICFLEQSERWAEALALIAACDALRADLGLPRPVLIQRRIARFSDETKARLDERDRRASRAQAAGWSRDDLANRLQQLLELG